MSQRIPITTALWAAALIPVCFIAWIIWRFGLDVPHMDQWELVPILQKYNLKQPILNLLWSPHNEHRLFIPRLVMLWLAQATHWNILWELALNFFLALLVGLILVGILRRAYKLIQPASSWLFPLSVLFVSLFMFSPTQWHNWVWGWQNQIFFNILGLAAAAWSLSRYGFRVPGLLLGTAGAIVAMLSFANGLLLFFLLTVFFLLPLYEEGSLLTRLPAAVLIFSQGVIGSAFYLKGMTLSSSPALNQKEILAHIYYLLAYLGSSLCQFSIPLAVFWGTMGLTGFVATVLFLERKDRRTLRILSPFLLLASYALFSALLTSLGRVSFETKQALAPRYVAISSLFWISLTVLWVFLWGKMKPKEGKEKQASISVKVLGVLVVFASSLSMGFSWVYSYSALHSYHRVHLVGLECVRHYRDASERCLRIHALDPRQLRERAAWLEENRLSLFRKD
jgi:hypothetical protein